MLPLPLRRVLLAAAMLFAAARADARGLIASPTQLGLTGPPGSVVTGVVTVASSRSEQNDVRAVVRDFFRTESGELKILPANESGGARSCRQWLSVERSSFVTPPSGPVELPVRVRIPEGAAGSYWAVLLLSTAPVPRGGERGIGFDIVPQVAIPIFVTVTGTEKRELKLLELSAVTKPDGKVAATALLENRGNTAVILNGGVSLEESTESGAFEEVSSADLPRTVSLPGSRSRVVATVEGKASSRSRLHLIVRYGPGAGEIVEGDSAIAGEVHAKP